MSFTFSIPTPRGRKAHLKKAQALEQEMDPKRSGREATIIARKKTINKNIPNKVSQV